MEDWRISPRSLNYYIRGNIQMSPNVGHSRRYKKRAAKKRNPMQVLTWVCEVFKAAETRELTARGRQLKLKLSNASLYDITVMLSKEGFPKELDSQPLQLHFDLWAFAALCYQRPDSVACPDKSNVTKLMIFFICTEIFQNCSQCIMPK